MKTFKHYLVEFDTPTIYCDMDGVLADFVSFTTKHLGKPFTDEYWSDLPDNLFYQLSPMQDAKHLWNFIGKYNPNILTAIPRESRGPVAKRAANDKKLWMKKHFGVSEDRIYAIERINKKNFAIDGRDKRPNLLIDDYLRNVQDFRKRGGLGVHHISARNTIKELKSIGYK